MFRAVDPPGPSMGPGKTGKADGRALILFLAAVFLLLGILARKVGFVWDETLYFGFARETAQAFGRVLEDMAHFRPLQAFFDLMNAPAWKDYPQIGFMSRYVQGFFDLLFHPVFAEPWSCRAASSFLWCLMLYFLFRISEGSFGVGWGWCSMVLALGFPRLLGHALLGTTESALLLMWVAGIFVFLRCFDGEWPPWVFGLFWGAAMTAKFQMAGSLFGMALWGLFYDRGRTLRILGWSLFLGPLVFLAVQPCYWLRLGQNLSVYWNQWAHHNRFSVPLYFLGRSYQGHGPWYYSPLLLVFTIPLPYFLLGLQGAIDSFRRKDPRMILFLVLGSVPLLMLMSPNAPAYDGERLFVQAYPAWVLLATGGLLHWSGRVSIGRKRALMACAVLTFFILCRTHPFYLEYFSAAVGGPSGAKKIGLETSYSMDALNEDGIKKIDGIVPSGGQISLLGYPEHLLRLYQQLGWLKPDIRYLSGFDPASGYLLIYFRQSCLNDLGTLEDMKPALRIDFQGVTLLKLVKKRDGAAS